MRFDSLYLSRIARRCLLGILLGIGGVSIGDAEEVRIAHCLAGCPKGAAADDDLIVRSIYALSFNNHNLVADWVAYRVTDASIGVATNLSRKPLRDPYLAVTLDEQDFQDSAAVARVERNLFVPLVSFAGTPFWNEVNYLSNAVPRNPELNRGSWYGLEWAVRNLASRSGELYLLTGPLYDPLSPQVPLATAKPHRVPAGFFKVVANAEGKVSAFRFSQQLAFYVHHCDSRTTLDEVERLTGLDLFPDQPSWPTGNLDPQLGCF